MFRNPQWPVFILLSAMPWHIGLADESTDTERPLTASEVHEIVRKVVEEGYTIEPGTFESMTGTLSKGEVDLLREYQQGFERARDFYTKSKMVAVVTETIDNTSAPRAKFTTKTTYYGHDATTLRVDKLTTASNGYSDDANVPKVGSQESFLCYDEGVIVAASDHEDSPWVVRKMDRDKKGALAQFGNVALFPHAPFTIGGSSADMVLCVNGAKLLHFKVVAVETKTVEGVERVAISARDDFSKFEFEFLRDSWVLTSATISSAGPTDSSDTITNERRTYGTCEPGDMPPLRSIRNWMVGDGEEYALYEASIESFEPGPVPLEEFTPEAIHVTARFPAESRAWWIYTMVIGGMFIIFGAFLRRRQKLSAAA